MKYYDEYKSIIRQNDENIVLLKKINKAIKKLFEDLRSDGMEREAAAKIATNLALEKLEKATPKYTEK